MQWTHSRLLKMEATHLTWWFFIEILKLIKLSLPAALKHGSSWYLS